MPTARTDALPKVVKPVPGPVAPQRVSLLLSAPSSVAAGEQFTLEVKVASVNDLLEAPFSLSYDPARVEFVAVNEGDFLKRGGVSTLFGNSVSPAAGSVTVNLRRSEGGAGASGAGTLVMFVFRAKQKGAAAFSLRDAGFSGSQGNPVEVIPPTSTVEIR